MESYTSILIPSSSKKNLKGRKESQLEKLSQQSKRKSKRGSKRSLNERVQECDRTGV